MSATALTQEFIRRLRTFVRRRVPSDADADDITQNVLLKFVRAGESIEAGRGPSWMFTVARREIIDRYRRTKLATSDVGLEAAAAAQEQDPSAISELSHCVHPLLQLLSPEDREILRRVDLEGEAQSAIADGQGIARSTLKARVQRARQRFHEQLLACCSIAIDTRGNPHSIEPRPDSSCDCNAAPDPSTGVDPPAVRA